MVQVKKERVGDFGEKDELKKNYKHFDC